MKVVPVAIEGVSFCNPELVLSSNPNQNSAPAAVFSQSETGSGN
jgi:hypothetical protein